jgi:hypothetical protein
MLEAHEDAEEHALWSAIESLEEGADLADELGDRNNGRSKSSAKRVSPKQLERLLKRQNYN